MRMTSNARARDDGARFEDVALVHLERAGLTLLERNFHCRYGEIDLVMRDSGTIVFVEVRYRRGGSFGDGIDSVNAGKRAKLVRAAEVFLMDHPRLADATCRFDVIAISGAAATPSIDWRRNAFET
ncbi:MAG: YraN family protein [Rhodanobacteraceae bacterium]